METCSHNIPRILLLHQPAAGYLLHVQKLINHWRKLGILSSLERDTPVFHVKTHLFYIGNLTKLRPSAETKTAVFNLSLLKRETQTEKQTDSPSDHFTTSSE